MGRGRRGCLGQLGGATGALRHIKNTERPIKGYVFFAPPGLCCAATSDERITNPHTPFQWPIASAR